MCSSGDAKPTYQMQTPSPVLIAWCSSRAIVLPPSVVSKEKSSLLLMARCRALNPSFQALALAWSVGRQHASSECGFFLVSMAIRCMSSYYRADAALHILTFS
jgi:hypothetical protein